MAKYTTELRTMCEVAYGLTGAKDEVRPLVDVIVESDKVQNSIFNFEYPIFDENYRPTLQKKILKHYYTREIGEETVELFKLRLNTRLNEILPYYNQLYASELIEFNPLYTINYQTNGQKIGLDTGAAVGKVTLSGTDTTRFGGTVTDKFDGSEVTDFDSTTDEGTDSTANESLDSTNTLTHETGNWDLYSDTPQGGVNGIVNAEVDPSIASNGYLTNARHTFGDGGEDVTVIDQDTETTIDKDVHTVVDSTNDKTTDNTNVRTYNNNEATQYGKVTDSRQDTTDNSKLDYFQNVVGWNGQTASKSLMEFRKTFLNIDMMIIEKLDDLFMNIW